MNIAERASHFLTMLGEVRLGCVAVYQTHDATSAHLGELSVTSLKRRGCAGAVIDGGCRDVEYIVREEFPVLSRYSTPQDCVGRWEVVATDVPITIGGVRVESGDKQETARRSGAGVEPTQRWATTPHRF